MPDKDTATYSNRRTSTMARKLTLLLASSFTALFVLNGCSQRPVLYDNATYKSSPAKAEAAIDDCLAKAEAVSKGSKLKDSAYRAVAGGTASAAAGGAAAAAGNAFSGNYDIGGSMGMSAAAGAAGNFVLGLFDQDVDPVTYNYVQSCLQERGYRLIGWQ
jgi:hypothetical protein